MHSHIRKARLAVNNLRQLRRPRDIRLPTNGRVHTESVRAVVIRLRNMTAEDRYANTPFINTAAFIVLLECGRRTVTNADVGMGIFIELNQSNMNRM